MRRRLNHKNRYIYQWDDPAREYTSTEPFDFSEETIDARAAELGVEGDCDFVGMTIMAANNCEAGSAQNEAMGEGKIILGGIMTTTGKAKGSIASYNPLTSSAMS